MPDEASRLWAVDMAAAYAQYLVPPVFQPWADELASRIARLRPGVVLELAAGTGVLTKAVSAALPGAVITATDLNVAMVDVGTVQVPTATWRQADAMRLPFDAGCADLVACQFGVMFFPDRPAAYAQVHRVLRPGGRFVFTTWGPLVAHGVEAAVTAALADCFPADPPTFLARVPHGYHDVERIRADLAVARFTGARVEVVELACAGTSAEHLARGYCGGTPLRAEIEARGDLSATTRAVQTALERRFGTGRVVAGMQALVVTAEVPRGAPPGDGP